MDNKNDASINLLRGIMNFDKDDPLWYRLVVLLIVVAFILAVLWLLKGSAAPLLAINEFRGTGLFKGAQSRSP